MIFEANSPDSNRDFMSIAPFAIYDGDGVRHDWVIEFDPSNGRMVKIIPGIHSDFTRGYIGAPVGEFPYHAIVEFYPIPFSVAPFCFITPDTSDRTQGDMQSPCLGQMKKAGCEIIEV